tara:strand:+ start:327 stop:566 length:240 start_codon:yes stop_codon:yes gene_type:complete
MADKGVMKLNQRYVSVSTAVEDSEQWNNGHKVSRQRVHQLMRMGDLGVCIKEETPRGAFWWIPYPIIRTEHIRRRKKSL